MAPYPKAELDYIIDHVVLPPQLPQGAESAQLTASAEKILLDWTLTTVRHFRRRCSPELMKAWVFVQDMLSRWSATNPHIDLSQPLLEQAISTMKPGDVLPICIRAQNACLALRHVESALTVECFELCARSADVVGCKGSLRRHFPAHGVAVPIGIATDTHFRHEMCHQVAKLAQERVEEMMPQSTKAGSAWTENRDTCHPRLVTEMLMATLAAAGSPIEVLQVQKRIRDDVLWDQCSVPWRRSPLWLILRVSIQTTLAQRMDSVEAFTQYKNFMVFFLAEILGQAPRSGISRYRCKIIQMKMARRAAKIDGLILPFVQDTALAMAQKVGDLLDRPWRKVQEADAARTTQIDLTTVEEDTALTLHNCRPALDQALQESERKLQPTVQVLSSPHVWIIVPNDGIPRVNVELKGVDEKIYAMAEFEDWIWNTLPSWLEKASLEPRTILCSTLTVTAATYRDVALEVYSGSELLSLMLLVIGEVWRAIDTLAGLLLPLLHHYPPEISSEVFRPLLLPKRTQMERLHTLESYINKRKRSAKFPQSVFADPSIADTNCFHYQYYDQSTTHRELRQKIVADATLQRDAKEREWRQGTARYTALQKQYDAIGQCLMTVNAQKVSVHVATNCQRCRLKRTMDQMSISVFEWPLPKGEVACRAVVYELRCPAIFAAWRNFTWMVIHDLGRQRDSPAQPPHDFLDRYEGLASCHEQSGSRITLAASTKSVTASHYRQQQYPVEIYKVCCDNGIRWHLYDKNRTVWVSDQTQKPTLAGKCQTLLPNGSYKNLQYAVDYTTHAQNKVLAQQTECSAGLSLHEYVAFGSLRADGEQTQWLNICRELQASNLSWNTEAVCTLVRQSAWQVGTAGDTWLRKAHCVFKRPQFRTKLLSSLSRMLASIEANRQSVYTMNTLITLILRVLSLAGADAVSEAVCLLRRCRATTFEWVLGLIDTLRSAVGAKETSTVRGSLLRVALLCKVTFDVETRHLSEVTSSPNDLYHWTFSSIIVQDNAPSADLAPPADLRRLLIYDTKLSHAFHRQLQHSIVNEANSGLDQAILRTWSGFRSRDLRWEYHEVTGGRWLRKSTLPSPQNASQTVYYNLLNGRMLVDGRPLGALPPEYTTHHLFIRVFGAQILRVSSSDMAGMIYMTASEVYGYSFHFVIEGKDLVIRARTALTVFELIPHQRLADDFPTMLVEDHVHWLDLHTSELEFRPLSQRWTTNKENWRLHYIPQGESHLQQDGMRLVDIRSATYRNAGAVFGALELTEFMYVTWSHKKGLEVALPRLGFHFFVNRGGELECKELRKIIDPNQSLGTLIGLRSRLVLCAPGSKSRAFDRVVLIPKGKVSIISEGSHPVTHITTTGRDVQVLRYQHNAILNRLEGDGSMASRLYQSYLHALTASYLPDPLTGLLGTEESLRLLNEQQARCCKPLEAAEVDLLDLIASLTPRRAYYPGHLKVMQQVSWNKYLPPPIQHSGFFEVAERILAHSRQFHVFYSNLHSARSLKHSGDQSLLERARVRNSAFLNVDYNGEENSTSHDVDYPARDGVQDMSRAARVFSISSSISSWSKNLAPLQKLAGQWGSLPTVSGFGTSLDLSSTISRLLQCDFSVSWAPIYEYCKRATREDNQYKLLFLFSTIAYGSKVHSLDTLKILLAFATNPSLQALPPFPEYSFFTLANGSKLDRNKVREVIAQRVKPWTGPQPNTSSEAQRQQASEYREALALDVNDALAHYANQWPCKTPTSVKSISSKWLRIVEVDIAVRDLFGRWYKNLECQRHLALIQKVLDATKVATSSPAYEVHLWHQKKAISPVCLKQTLPTLEGLMASTSPGVLKPPSTFRYEQHQKALQSNKELHSLITNLDNGSKAYDGALRVQYKDDLLTSLQAFQGHTETVLSDEIPVDTLQRALTHYESCHEHCLTQVNDLCERLQPKEPTFNLLKLAGFWPRLRKCDLLNTVASVSHKTVTAEWKNSIIILGLCITVLQRARRLVLAAEKRDALSFSQELENPGRLCWSAHDWPDWLLIEIENDLLIRPIQARVALEMIKPSIPGNTLMQLNMGEGKSSVIIPLIAAALADGSQISRVIVLRSLARQMQDTIIRRLGGLARRPIYYMPFSRQTKVDEFAVKQMRAMYIQCKATRGVLIAQPEHMLSFKLMGFERLASKHMAIAAKLMEVQAGLDKYCRDVLDESDEILDVKFQLIYTLGAQRGMDGQPDRWLMMEAVFDLVNQQACLLQRQYPDMIDVRKQMSASFPTIRLLSAELRELLISKVLEDVCNSKIPGLVMSNLPTEVKNAAINFIAQENVSETECRTIQAHCSRDEFYLKKLLFVRGLIAGGILLHTLHAKRWSVNYGLDPSRCLCAVPYRAKGVPAPTAEFGHPDVTIALTCLSYYYSGLNDTQVRTCLEILQKADDPTAEYGSWTLADTDCLKGSLRHWDAVNLEDQQQCETLLFPALRYNKKVADFYLTNVVFPKEGKEFPQKLSTSGWDIPAKPDSNMIITGFSGTNDNRFLLPSSVSQRDLPELRHTSGKVLEFLARPENLGYSCAKDNEGAHLSSLGLLGFIQASDPSIRVLIDVGAQILDLSNDQVVQRWLSLVSDADAGVYFDERDVAMVLTKTGTDLKLPLTARAAVTLGPRLTKDRLVQACMRLRQLGHGQSLMFFAPPEVHQEIAGTAPTANLDSLNVIKWALEQSCLQIQRNQPLRVIQGLEFFHRREVAIELKQRWQQVSDATDTNSFQDLIKRIVEDEAQTLKDLYAPNPMRDQDETSMIKISRTKQTQDVKDLIRIWDQIDQQTSRGAGIHEEHEREVAHEAEKEKQIKRPPRAVPAKPQADPRLSDFIRTGTSLSLDRFDYAHQAILRQSSAASQLRGSTVVWSRIRVTSDFTRTVKEDKAGKNNDYLRPVHWVLVSKDKAVGSVLLISQFEVNKFFKEVLDPSSRVTLVCYEARVTRSMPSLDTRASSSPNATTGFPLPGSEAAWKSLSDTARRELHLFAGQLYFTTFAEYEKLSESFSSRKAVPVGFVREWVGIRRKGQNYLPTHIGQVVSGRVLHKEMFESVDAESTAAAVACLD